MENPLKQKVEIKHSKSKNAWNIIGTSAGSRYKIARIPYNQLPDKDNDEYKEQYDTQEKAEALKIAQYIVTVLNK